MNKELELEAEQYEDLIDRSEDGLVKETFIAGATSKYVERQKLEFAIEQLKLIDEEKTTGTEHNSFYDLIEMKEKTIKQLEQKLSEL